MDRAPCTANNKKTFFGPRCTVHGSLLLALFFLAPPLHAAPPSEDKVWMVVRPLQCMRNPWEQEWLKRNKNQVTKYPRQKEFALVRNYFKNRRVPILDFRLKPFLKGDGRCETCECPRGDTFFLLISALDVPTMVSLGYSERLPAAQTP